MMQEHRHLSHMILVPVIVLLLVVTAIDIFLTFIRVNVELLLNTAMHCYKFSLIFVLLRSGYLESGCSLQINYTLQSSIEIHVFIARTI